MGSEVKSERDMDAQIAEKVMGWKWCAAHIHGDGCKYLCDPTDEIYFRGPVNGQDQPAKPDAKLCGDWDRMVPYFTSDPAADYEILKRVRETLVEGLVYADFYAALVRIWKMRFQTVTGMDGNSERCCLCYEPGDYSRAALAALEDNP